MFISAIINFLETVAPLSLQEGYDNAGLITGDPQAQCTGVLFCLDATEAVVKEAREKGCNLIVAHHPIVFSGLKKLDPGHYVSRAIIRAVKDDIAIYAIHTNLDNILTGVNGKMADILGLKDRRVLRPATGSLRLMVTYVPIASLDKVRDALFAAGAGQVGANYDECGYVTEGTGSFRALSGADPFVGSIGIRHYESESRLEMIFGTHLQHQVMAALQNAHPYEEVAYQIIPIQNKAPQIGAGLVGQLPEPLSEIDFLRLVQETFELKVLRHTSLLGKKVKTVAICGGAGSFLIPDAIRSGAEVFLTADMKYHEFFEANERLVLADLGHFESEQYTVNLLFDLIREKFPNFAVLKTGIRTNPVHYLI